MNSEFKLLPESTADDRKSLCKFSFLLIALTLLAGGLCLLPSPSDAGGEGAVNLVAPPPPPPYLGGWMRTEWTACAADMELCPSKDLDTPRVGCAGATTDRVLLTGAGLSHPHARDAFRTVLLAAAGARGPRHDIAVDRRVFLVLDAAYDAYEAGTQFTSSREYCVMRQAELGSLGASTVVCVILDPTLRERAWQRGQNEGGASRDFGDAMHAIDDDYIFQELHRAVAVFVECGSPIVLVKNFRRPLHLTTKVARSISGLRPNLRDIIRARVLDKEGALAYVGVSSGASLAGENMTEMSAEDLERLGDNSGLALVPNCSFYPHATATDGPVLHRLAEVYRTDMMAVPDCQPVSDMHHAGGRLGHICP